MAVRRKSYILLVVLIVVILLIWQRNLFFRSSDPVKAVTQKTSAFIERPNSQKNVQTSKRTTTHRKEVAKKAAPPTQTSRKTCDSVTAEQLAKAKTTRYGIPFIIHQIYKSEIVPSQYIPLVKGCRKINEDFLHILWTDEKAEKFLKTFYPDQVVNYARYRPGVEKSDFIRVLVLYHFGGVYMDLDVECLKPFATTLDSFKSSAILDHEIELQTQLLWHRYNTAMNSVMISRPKHPFFKYLLDKFPSTASHGTLLFKTGPFFLDDRFKEYQRQKNHSHIDQVVQAPSSAFTPLIDFEKVGVFNNLCNKPKQHLSPNQRIGCNTWNKMNRRQNETEALKDAILCHRFLHFAYATHRHLIKKWISLCTVLGVLDFVL